MGKDRGARGKLWGRGQREWGSTKRWIERDGSSSRPASCCSRPLRLRNNAALVPRGTSSLCFAITWLVYSHSCLACSFDGRYVGPADFVFYAVPVSTSSYGATCVVCGSPSIRVIIRLGAPFLRKRRPAHTRGAIDTGCATTNIAVDLDLDPGITKSWVRELPVCGPFCFRPA